MERQLSVTYVYVYVYCRVYRLLQIFKPSVGLFSTLTFNGINWLLNFQHMIAHLLMTKC